MAWILISLRPVTAFLEEFSCFIIYYEEADERWELVGKMKKLCGALGGLIPIVRSLW